jgi:hypothetical protein
MLYSCGTDHLTTNIVIIVFVHKRADNFVFSSFRFHVAMELCDTGNVLIKDCDILTVIMYRVVFFDFVFKLN